MHKNTPRAQLQMLALAFKHYGHFQFSVPNGSRHLKSDLAFFMALLCSNTDKHLGILKFRKKMGKNEANYTKII